MLLDLVSRQTTDTTQRSLVKTISWRCLAALDTFAISFFVTGRFAGAATIVGVEAITKIVWYYLHERGWDHITWGRYTPSWTEHAAGVGARMREHAAGVGTRMREQLFGNKKNKPPQK